MDIIKELDTIFSQKRRNPCCPHYTHKKLRQSYPCPSHQSSFTTNVGADSGASKNNFELHIYSKAYCTVKLLDVIQAIFSTENPTIAVRLRLEVR